MKPLQVIVATVPSQLEDFLSAILATIKNHHRRCAYFLFAMALRMQGFHLSDDNDGLSVSES